MAQQINLYNPAFRRQRQHFSAVTMLQALGLLVAGILAFYGHAIHETRTLTQVSADADKQLKAQTAQLIKLTQEFSPQGRSRMLEDEVARAAIRLKQREEMLSTVRTGGLGNTEGFARYLLAFARQPVSGVWLTGFSVGGDETELLLNGRVLHADLVPAYIRALNREEVMRGRRVTELRMTARESRDAAGTAAPGGPAVAPAAPSRYVEFNLVATRGPVVPGTAASAAAKPGPDATAPKSAPARSPEASLAGRLRPEENAALCVFLEINEAQFGCAFGLGKFCSIDELAEGVGPEKVKVLSKDPRLDSNYEHRVTTRGDRSLVQEKFVWSAIPRKPGLAGFFYDGRMIYYNPNGPATDKDKEAPRGDC